MMIYNYLKSMFKPCPSRLKLLNCFLFSEWAFQRTCTGYFASIFVLLASCTKLSDVPPPDNASTGATVYQEDATAIAVLSGIYGELASGVIAGGSSGISFLTGLSGDELKLVSPAFNENLERYYTNNISPELDEFDGLWSSMYRQIHTINSAIEGLSYATKLTPSVKQQLEGEALFMRAFFHFYLVNLYGDVPLVLTSDYRQNIKQSRTPTEEVYQQIVEDLRTAETLLSPYFLGSDLQQNTDERVRPTKWAATAFLSRVYLYQRDWVNAEIKATEILQNTTDFQLSNLSKSFLKNNTEAVWQLMSIEPGLNTVDGRIYIPTYGFDYFHPAALSESLVNEFEANDQRKVLWTNIDPSSGWYFAYKYKKDETYEPDPAYEPEEYLMVLRLAEMYLVRAEARIQSGNLEEGILDINQLRIRASKPAPDNLPILANGLDKESALRALEHERRVEFFTEWGHRWLDLKRWTAYANPAVSRIDEIMPDAAISKGSEWQSSDKFFPIPFEDLRLNPNLNPQNPGY
jgi:hypothetical protein